MKFPKCLLSAALGLLCTAGGALAQATHVTISQVYGAGGNAGAVYNADYVELFNPTNAPVNIGGWALQYASSTGAFSGGTTFKIDIPSGATIASHGYFLVKTGTASATVGAALPTPDLDSSAISASGTSGKFALISNNAYLTSGNTGNCPTGANLVDYVGFGNAATCAEGGTGVGSGTTTLSATLAAFRLSGGCVDTNVNSADFVAQAPLPRNSSSALNVCSSSTPPTAVGSTAPNLACPGTLLTFTVTTTPGSSPTAAVTTVTGDFQAIGLSGTESFTEAPTNTWTFTTTLNNVAAQNYSFPISIADSLGRTGSASISLQVTSCNPFIPAATATAMPTGICNGSTTVLSVVVQPGQNPTSASMTVTADLSSIGDANPATFSLTSPNTYTYVATVANGTATGPKAIVVTATDDQLRSGTRTLNLVTAPCVDSASTVVISQVYGGGGNSGATLTNDFVELFNRGNVAVNITGWSVQYASATDTNGGFGSGMNPATNVPVVLSGTLQPGQYYLVQMAAGTGGSQPLPTPDATGGLTLGATAGRIALSDSSAPLLTDCTNVHIRDLVGYGEGTGAAVCFEGDTNVGPTATLDNTTAAIRNLAGCQDTDRNRIDFTVGTPTPRNTASPIHNCGPVVTSGVCCRGATCNTTITTAAACSSSLTGSPTAGAAFVSTATVCNASATVNTPCCYADYNKTGGISVQDIFDFLSDWFAGFPYANTGGSGAAASLNVQNIFDFLTDWFAGGCS